MTAILESLQTGASLPASRQSLGAVTLPRVMTSIVVAVALADCVWGYFGHFDIDARAYAVLAALSVGLSMASLFYDRVRQSPPIAAVFFGTAFLISFSASFSVMNYLLLTVAHTRIDAFLAHVDVMLGVDWPAMMRAVALHPLSNLILHVTYISVLPQLALVILCLGWMENAAEIHRFCLALAIGAAICIAFWTAFPSFGAFSVYDLPSALSSRLNLELNTQYARELEALLSKGPGYITPHELRGLIGFPSYHAAMAMLAVWYARSLRYLCWPLLAWNLVVLVATPVHGGHHVIDVLAGIGVAALSVALTAWIARNAARQDSKRECHWTAELNAQAGEDNLRTA